MGKIAMLIKKIYVISKVVPTQNDGKTSREQFSMVLQLHNLTIWLGIEIFRTIWWGV